MYCQKCGAENPDEAKFCKNCGFQIQKEETINCPTCGAVYLNLKKFCSECGNLILKKTDNLILTKKIHFYWAGRGGPFTSKMEVLINNEIIGSGPFNNGFDFIRTFDLTNQKSFNLKLKCWFTTYFNQVVDFSQIRKDSIEFEDDVSLFKDRLIIKN